MGRAWALVLGRPGLGSQCCDFVTVCFRKMSLGFTGEYGDINKELSNAKCQSCGG